MSITPELCRAGRALLTWTQRDLADRAQTGVSTVADFERGARAPIAQTIEALEAALRDGGVSFDGGGAMLAGGTGGFAHLDGGRPIPLLGPKDLEDWANRLGSEAELPMLIAMLVRASAGADAVLRFPAGEGVRDPGWDGSCESPRAADNVPAGLSRWELSVQKQPSGKAERDYTKRAVEGSPEQRAATTYVAVSLRVWSKKDDWADERRADGIFKDVRALDVHDILTWLAIHPAVMNWLAVRIGKRSISGSYSLEEGWRRWAFATTPPLTVGVVLAGRDQEVANVLAWLRGPASVLHIQAAEKEEAIAFLYGAIAQLPPAYRETYRTHAIVAETDSAVREIAVAMKPQIIIMNGADLGFAASTAAAGHHVYAIHGPDTKLEKGVVLKEVRRTDLADALEDTVLGMGQKAEVARTLAARAGGSIATLRRLLSEAAAQPGWMRTVSRSTVVAAFFAGAWDDAAPVDQEIVARLAQRPFNDVNSEFATLSTGVGAPLRRSISKVQVVSIQDLWSIIAPDLTKADVTAFFAVARDVFSPVDPRFHDTDRARQITYGERPQMATAELRRGLLEALNVMMAYPERATNVPFLEHDGGPFVRDLLEEADAARWWSVRDSLPLLAEVAPSDFLVAVEESATRDDAPIGELLRRDGTGFFGRDYAANLTTALERLAWFPDHFDESVSALAALAEIDPSETRNGNRPAASLRQAFWFYHPQTLATLDARMATLARLRDRHPEVAWHLLIALLPKHMGDSSSYSSKPQWRPLPANDAPPSTAQREKHPFVEILEWLIEDAGRDLARWKQLLESLTGFEAPEQRRVTDAMLAFVRTLDDAADHHRARDIVRAMLHRHREFGLTTWALTESVLEPLQVCFDLLRPADIVDREAWVFANQPAPPDPVPGHELHLIEGHNEAHRQRVARELLSAADVGEILSMARAVENPVQLGMALVAADVDDALRDELVVRGALSAQSRETEFARGIVLAGVRTYGAPWAATIVRTGVSAGWSSDALVSILQGMPQDEATFALADEAGDDVAEAYWKRTPWMWFIHSDPAALGYAVVAKLRVGEAVQAVSLIGQVGPKPFPPETLLRALKDASAQLRDAVKIPNASMLSYYCGLILDRLVADTSVDRDELMRLEWSLFGLMQASDRNSALLEAGLARYPEFFVQIVSSVYRAEDDDGSNDGADIAQLKAVAHQSWTLLDKWSVVPGTQTDGTLDASALDAWVQRARALAVDAKRVAIVDQQIGVILAAAAAEPNGDWPPKPVRDVIERVRSKALEGGLQMGTRNRRGPITRGPLDGGDLERDLKTHYEALATRLRSGYPRTAKALGALAASFKVEAVYHDQWADAIDRL